MTVRRSALLSSVTLLASLAIACSPPEPGGETGTPTAPAKKESVENGGDSTSGTVGGAEIVRNGACTMRLVDWIEEPAIFAHGDKIYLMLRLHQHGRVEVLDARTLETTSTLELSEGDYASMDIKRYGYLADSDDSFAYFDEANIVAGTRVLSRAPWSNLNQRETVVDLQDIAPRSGGLIVRRVTRDHVILARRFPSNADLPDVAVVRRSDGSIAWRDKLPLTNRKQGDSIAIQTDGTSVFAWTRGSIIISPLATFAPKTLFTATRDPKSLADGIGFASMSRDNVFFETITGEPPQAATSVLRLSKSGGEPAAIATKVDKIDRTAKRMIGTKLGPVGTGQTELVEMDESGAIIRPIAKCGGDTFHTLPSEMAEGDSYLAVLGMGQLLAIDMGK